MQKIWPRKGTLTLSEDGILYDAVLLQLCLQTVPVGRQKLFRRVLLRQRVFLKNADLDLLSGEELFSYSFFQ